MVGGFEASGGGCRLAGQAGRLFKSRTVLPRSPGTRSPTRIEIAGVPRERGSGSPEVWRESAKRTTARPQAIHTLQTPRSFSANLSSATE